MTTGTKIKNNTYRFDYNNFVTGTVGHYWSSSWSGPNTSRVLVRAKPRPTSAPPYPQPEYRWVWRKGRLIRVRTNKPSPEQVAQWQALKAAAAMRSGSPKTPRRKAARPPTNYSKSTVESNTELYLFRKRSNPSAEMGASISSIYGWTDTHLPIDAGQEYKLIAKLRTKAYGSGFHPGIFAAEAPQALRMIGDAAKKLRRGMLHAALGNLRGVFRNFGRPTDVATRTISTASISYLEGRMTFSRFWLELSYGWKPLLGDLEAATALLAEQLNGGAAANSRRVCASREFQSEANTSSSNVMYYRHKVTKTRLRYVITNLTASPVTGLPSVPSVLGVIWEKVPYSFVCDWVVPISDYLAALRTASDLRGTVVRSCKQTTTFSDIAINRGTWDLGPIPLTGSGTSLEIMKFTRSVSDEISPPLPVTENLSIGGVFSSWQRAANAVALLQNLRFSPGDRTGIKKLLGR